MTIDIIELGRRIREHEVVARVVIADSSGSVPRSTGTSMIVWQDGQSGTIGGGALEYTAAGDARAALEGNSRIPVTRRMPLGPGLGQCCGGSVTLVTELYDKTRLAELQEIAADGELYVRPINANAGAMPDAILDPTREDWSRATHIKGWLAEPLTASRRLIWLYGAGHVGRAIVAILDPLEAFEIVWVDISDDRFPDHIPEAVEQLIATNPADAASFAHARAEHLVMTHSHAHDLAICDRILSQPFRSLGLIGSRSKWARFRKRLIQSGHSPSTVDRIECPIGMPVLGKHPQAIAVGLAFKLLEASKGQNTQAREPE